MHTPVRLSNPRFLSFLGAQFLGAFNDNALKLIVSMAALSLITDASARAGYLAGISALAILPFVLFSGYAGYFADRYRKSSVLRVSKAMEIPAMLAVLLIFMFQPQGLDYLLVALFLLAVHSAFFSPSKYGILPEIMSAENLPKANGYLNMLTFVAIITGSLSGATLWQYFEDEPVYIGLILVGIAVLGTVLCLFVPQGAAGNAQKKFNLNPFGEIISAVPLLTNNRILWSATFGSLVYWLLGGLIYLSLILLGKTELGLDETASGSLFSFLALGIGIGSVLAGNIVGKSVRRTLLVWGALLLSAAGIACARYATDYTNTAVLIGLMGFGAGLFIVPVMTLLQKNAPEAQRGRVLAASSFFDMLGVLLASGIFWLLGSVLGLSASGIIALAGVLSLCGLLLAIIIAPTLLYDAIESAIYWLARRVYKIRLVGDGLDGRRFPQPNTPTVFAANHVTFVDGLLISALSGRPVRFLVLSTFWKKPLTRFVLNAIRAIPFGTGGVSETRKGLDAARACLESGGYICIFPEGVLTRTGHLQPFKRGIEKILEGIDAEIVPIHLERLWGSIFSFSGRRFFKKWPQRLPYPVTVAVGKPVPATTPAWRLNQIISELGTEAIPHRYSPRDTLARRFIRHAKRRPFAPLFADSMGQNLTALKALVGARVLARWLSPQLGAAQNVAVLLPATVVGALVNIALVLLGKTSVNLNFSLGKAAMESALKKAGVERVITSTTFMEKLQLSLSVPLIDMEQAKGSITKTQRTLTFITALVLPTRLLRRLWSNGKLRKDHLATVLFSSGSTAEPKGVCLSHENIIANIDSIATLLEHAEGRESLALAGILPFFHSFGFTACLWLPAITGRRIAYHPNPLEAKTVVKLIEQHQCGILVATPTFVRQYVVAAKDGALDSVRQVITGGEKLTDSVAALLTEKLPKAHILQGYGCTELGPVVAVNVPDIRHGGLLHRGHAAGSVGKPIPGVTPRVVDTETGALLAPEQEGLLLIKSPAQMRGYIGDAETTAAAHQDGWYITGDIVKLDADGFIHITDRLSRFSKIGGEMVPHGKIEDTIERILGEKAAVVVSIPDAQKGERLCVLLASTALSPAELVSKLKESDMPNLWLPRAEMIFVIEALPLLSTGKIDLRGCKEIARRFSEQQ
ncbi:MAG: MFS transporter [Alphaproteobacteria bacterium]|nr:MFS transporter [Alphaproteobacteria bacterium]